MSVVAQKRERRETTEREKRQGEKDLHQSLVNLFVKEAVEETSNFEPEVFGMRRHMLSHFFLLSFQVEEIYVFEIELNAVSN